MPTRITRMEYFLVAIRPKMITRANTAVSDVDPATFPIMSGAERDDDRTYTTRTYLTGGTVSKRLVGSSGYVVVWYTIFAPGDSSFLCSSHLEKRFVCDYYVMYSA